MEIYIRNAGLVILNGYLTYFFERCNYLDNQGNIAPELTGRAALLLQYVCDPDSSFEEYDLVLNKLLCGLVLDEDIPSRFDVNEIEKQTTEQMIDSIIVHWEVIKNSTPQAFRESWLWREGKLTNREDYWELLVEQRSFDVLLDYIPFSLSPVIFKWMPLPIKVIWR